MTDVKRLESKQKIDFNRPILDEDDQPIFIPKTDGRKQEILFLSLNSQQVLKLQEHLELKTPQEVVTWLTTDLGIDGKKVEEEVVTLGSLVCNVLKGRAQVDEEKEKNRPVEEAKAESKLRAKIVRKIRSKKSKAQTGEYAIIGLKPKTAVLIQDLLWSSKLDHIVYYQANEMIAGHSGLSEDESDDEEI